MTERFIDRFKKYVALYPDAFAVIQDNGETLTYQALSDRVQLLAAKLQSMGCTSGKLVALELPKSIDYLVSLLAVWQTGSAWVPIAPDLPTARKDAMRLSCKPYLTITTDGIITSESHNDYSVNLAYVIFTSGSSGEPKGVMIPHDGLINVIEQQIAMFHIQQESRALWLLSHQFDASISDIGVTLLSGACLIIPDPEDLVSPEMINRLAHQHRITYIDLPPALLPLLSPESKTETLKTVVIGGEVCPAEVVRRWAQHVRLINVYGPTETTICSSMRLCDEQWDNPNIGTPIDGIHYHLARSESESELLIGGHALALGYIDQPKLTQEKFVVGDGKRLYRTGDLVRGEPDGSYVYLGRIDRQIKLAGKLIAPEEIESTLAKHADINRAAVICHNNRLFAFIESDGALSSRAIRNRLKEKLPTWMLPRRVISVEQLPILASGKIDYDALQDYASQHRAQQAEESYSKDSSEKRLQEIWQAILELQTPPSVDEDFYNDLGGDSLKALEAILAAEERDLLFPSGAIAEHRSIKAMVHWLKSNNNSALFEALSADELCASIAHHSIGESNLSPNHDDCILITGATGFLGIHLVAELQANLNDKMVCLIRADHIDQAKERLARTARYFQLTIDMSQIECICGDISKPKLGLNESAWQQLAKEVGSIYHCAAEIHALKPYSELYPANVGGTLSILELASTHHKKRVHYASTLSVFVAAEPLPVTCFESDQLEQTEMVYGGYAQSKWAAETACWNHATSPSTVYRLGLLTGHSQHGLHAHKDYLKLFVESLEALGCVPDGQWDDVRMDVTPIDYAAKAVAAISLNPDHDCYHISASQTVSFDQLIGALRRAGAELKTIPLCEWQQLFAALNVQAGPSLMALSRLFDHQTRFKRYRSMDLFQATGTQFDQSNTLQALKDTTIVCPQIDDALLDRYIRRFLHG